MFPVLSQPHSVPSLCREQVTRRIIPSLADTRPQQQTAFKWEGLFSNSTMWLPQHTWHGKGLELMAFGGFGETHEALFYKIPFSFWCFFNSNLVLFFFSFWDVMSGMHEFQGFVFFPFLLPWNFTLSCFFHQGGLQDTFFLCVLFFLQVNVLSDVLYIPPQAHTYAHRS